jgi:hypothetical protein
MQFILTILFSEILRISTFLHKELPLCFHTVLFAISVSLSYKNNKIKEKKLTEHLADMGEVTTASNILVGK